MTTEVKAYPAYGREQFKLVIHDTDVPTFEGRLAITLMEKFGLIACTDAGEDSAGRHQLRLMEPSDVVVRACELAEIMTRALQVRGWIVKAPNIAEAERQIKEKEPA